VIAEKMARSARPFTDWEFVRNCMQEVAKIMLPNQARLFENISLSRNSNARRIEDIGEDLSGQLSSEQGCGRGSWKRKRWKRSFFCESAKILPLPLPHRLFDLKSNLEKNTCLFPDVD